MTGYLVDINMVFYCSDKKFRIEIFFYYFIIMAR